MQRLRPAEHRRERLDRRPGHVHERLLPRQRDTRRLRVEPHQQRALVAGAVRVAQLACPDPACRPVLGDLLEEVDVGVEEEAQPRGELVDAEAASVEDRNLMPVIVDAVRDGVTLGEICDTWRSVWGTWREQPVF